MEIPRHWRIRKERYSMVGGVCPNCETKMFPAREICPQCGNGALISIQLDNRELVYSQPVAVANHG